MGPTGSGKSNASDVSFTSEFLTEVPEVHQQTYRQQGGEGCEWTQVMHAERQGVYSEHLRW